MVSLPLLVELGSAIHVVLSKLEHAVEEDGQTASHGCDCFGWTEAATGATELRTEITLTGPKRGGVTPKNRRQCLALCSISRDH